MRARSCSRCTRALLVVRVHAHTHSLRAIFSAHGAEGHAGTQGGRITKAVGRRRRCDASESRCRPRKSRKEFDVLVDGGSRQSSPMAHRTHAYPTCSRIFPFSFPCFSIFFFLLLSMRPPAWGRAGNPRPCILATSEERIDERRGRSSGTNVP